MLGKVNFAEYEICYPSRMKRYFRRNINYLPNTYDDIIPGMKNAVVGNIPPEIINLFGSDKENKIKIFQNILAEMANHIRATRTQMKSDKVTSFKDYYSPEKIKIYEQNISGLFNEKLAQFFGDEFNAELKFVNNGGFAELFRFSLKDRDGNKIMHDKALKVFYNIVEPLDINKRKHNNFAEANFWTYISYIAGHKLDRTQFTRHYISDMKSGYYLTEFVDGDIKKTTSPLSLAMLGIRFTDWGNNKPILGKMYDGGGFEKLSYFIDDPVTLRYFKKIVNRNTQRERLEVLANQERMVENPKIPHRDKIKKANDLYRSILASQQKSEAPEKPKKDFFITRCINRIINFFTNKQYKMIDYFNNNNM